MPGLKLIHVSKNEHWRCQAKRCNVIDFVKWWHCCLLNFSNSRRSASKNHCICKQISIIPQRVQRVENCWEYYEYSLTYFLKCICTPKQDSLGVFPFTALQLDEWDLFNYKHVYMWYLLSEIGCFDIQSTSYFIKAMRLLQKMYLMPSCAGRPETPFTNRTEIRLWHG